MNSEFSYDAVPYPSKFFLQTHPDRLAAAATLYGMTPAAPRNCRVLELGCGNGSNLVAQAFGLPNAEFVGVDLAENHILKANRAAKELGLANVEFRQIDVTQMSESEFGKFDYITAHGLIAWVPEFVRQRVFALFNELLNPAGVGYISYNAFPGAHAREMVRSMMRYHARDIDEPQEKVKKAIAFLKLVAENAVGPETYAPILRSEYRRHLEHSVEDIYHDDLGEYYRPYYFHEFAERLNANGMQFLSEAELHASTLKGLSSEVIESLDSFDNVVEREQTLDILRGRVFRQTLFCRNIVQLQRPPKPEVLKKLFLSSTLSPVEPPVDLAAEKVERFRSAKGQLIQIDHPLTKASLSILGNVWGRSIATTELLESAQRMIETTGATVADPEKETEITLSILMQLCLDSDIVELHSYAPEAKTNPGTRPKINRLSRWQLQDCSNVLTMLNKDLKLEDEIARHLLELMDGTRTKLTLITEMQKFVRSLKNRDEKQDLIRNMASWIDDSITELSRLGLFEAQLPG